MQPNNPNHVHQVNNILLITYFLNYVFFSVGTFSGIQQITCDAFPSGYYNTRNGSSKCIICPPGHSCAAASEERVPCEKGTSNNEHGQISCPSCGAGNYTDTTGKADCHICPAGSQCSDPAITPVPCEIDKYSEAGKVSCTTCAAGHYTTLTGSTYCSICGPGTHLFFEIIFIYLIIKFFL
jgi:hypothetical protein